jgi:glutamate racemase
MVEAVVDGFGNRTIGLIGTKRTVQSGIYARKIDEANSGIDLRMLATPLLAPMIEEGFFNNQISHEIIAQYLADPALAGVEALILACTHYPLIREEILGYYNGKMTVLDSSVVVAEALKEYLASSNLLNENGTGERHFYVSDYTEAFEAATRIFFDETVKLEKHPLWN